MCVCVCVLTVFFYGVSTLFVSFNAEVSDFGLVWCGIMGHQLL